MLHVVVAQLTHSAWVAAHITVIVLMHADGMAYRRIVRHLMLDVVHSDLLTVTDIATHPPDSRPTRSTATQPRSAYAVRGFSAVVRF